MKTLLTYGLWFFATINLAWGLFAIARPERAADWLGLRVVDERGDSEIRGVYGGLVAGLGLATLYLLSQPDAAVALRAFAITFLALALGRILGLFIGRRSAYGALVAALEAGVAAGLWWGAPLLHAPD